MDIESSPRREKMLKLREELLAVEEARLHGQRDCTVEGAAAMMEEVIEEAAHAG